MVEKIKNNKISFSLMAIGFIFLVVGFILLGGSKPKTNKDDSGKDNKPDYRVYLPEEEIKTLTGYLPSFKGSYYVYQDKKVSVDDVDKTIILESAIRHSNLIRRCKTEDIDANGQCDFIIRTSEVVNNLKNIYGIEDYELDASINGSGKLKCTLRTDYYACSVGQDEIPKTILNSYFEVENNYYTKFIKAEKIDNNLYIYEGYVRYEFDDITSDNLDNYSFNLYKYSNTDDLLVDDKLQGINFYEVNGNNNPFIDKIFNYLNDNYTTYKHTYLVKDDGTYSWVSTEPIDKGE